MSWRTVWYAQVARLRMRLGCAKLLHKDLSSNMVEGQWYGEKERDSIRVVQIDELRALLGIRIDEISSS